MVYPFDQDLVLSGSLCWIYGLKLTENTSLAKINKLTTSVFDDSIILRQVNRSSNSLIRHFLPNPR